MKSPELQEHRLNSEWVHILSESDDCFKDRVPVMSRKCWQMVGCLSRRWEQGHVDEEEGEEVG